MRLVLCSAILMLLLGVPPAAHGPVLAQRGEESPPVTVQIGANFYPPEVWERGKVRRWMSNNGEVVLVNEGAAPETVNVRFSAEAFRTPRDLDINLDGRRVAQWQVHPGAERYIVARALRLAPGRHRMVFSTPQAAVSPASQGQGRDQRPLSVAFTAFSVVDASDPEARADWTAPFAAGPASDKKATAQEHAAHFLRRQGRLVEAAAAYEQALRGGTADPTYLFYGMTLLAVDRRSDARRVFQECVSRAGGGILGTRVRDVCRRGLTYLGESLVLSPSAADAGRRSRAEGRIADAIETYRKAIAADPDSLHAHYWLAMIYGLAERRDDLRSHLDRAVSLAGDSPDGRFLRILRPYL